MPEKINTDFKSARLGPKRVSVFDFLSALFGPYYAREHHGFVEIRTIGSRGVKSYFFRGLHSLKQKNFDSRNLHTYYGLSPRERREGTKDSVRWVVALWADLDKKNFKLGKEESWEVLRGFQITPSIIVDSGGGLHALWLLKEPVSADQINEIESILRGIAKALNGDPAVCEIARVFRLPGSFNIKNQKSPDLVKVKFFSPHLKYELSDFADFRVPILEREESNNSEGIREEEFRGIEKVLACKFIRYSEAYARTLEEPLWWSALTNLLPFRGGRDKSHELSRPYKKGRNEYSFKETERKINHILKTAPGPHTCEKIAQYGYPCNFIGKCPVDSPAGLAWAKDEFIEGLKKESYEIKGEV